MNLLWRYFLNQIQIIHKDPIHMPQNTPCTPMHKAQILKSSKRCLRPLANLPFHNEQQTSTSHSLKYIIRRIKVKFWQCHFS